MSSIEPRTYLHQTKDANGNPVATWKTEEGVKGQTYSRDATQAEIEAAMLAAEVTARVHAELGAKAAQNAPTDVAPEFKPAQAAQKRQKAAQSKLSDGVLPHEVAGATLDPEQF